jgi:hypothetical protein
MVAAVVGSKTAERVEVAALPGGVGRVPVLGIALILI